MKLKIISTGGTESKEMELPTQFHEPVREDLIKKAVLAIQNNNRQPYGTYYRAGQRHSAEISKRRRDYRGCYGKGISRSNRKIMSRRGSQMHWVGAVSPEAVGGRIAHPPKPEKIWAWKLNTSERRKAIRSAISATVLRGVVEKRGHLIPANYPFIIEDSFESIVKTKELKDILIKLGFEAELARAENTGLRTGVAKIRGRGKTMKKSLLLVVFDSSKILRAAKNLPGVDVVDVRKLNTELLAPGSHPGRATLFSARAVEELGKGLFTNHYAQEKLEKKAGKNDKADSAEEHVKHGEKPAAKPKPSTAAKKKESKKK